MLKIRLQRTGRTNLPTYRLVIAEHTAAVKGKFLEKLGHYNPMKNPHVFEYDLERIRFWIERGAQPSSTVARLLKWKGIDGMDKFIIAMASRKKKSEAKAKPADAAAPAPLSGAAVTAAETVPAPAAPKEEKKT
ncbi:30S ribosomal protein S16 [Candidatus Peregrinibacteria bacterium]|nr:30S ribosomal protein S16 [Candidatus Peregrinibacteria bacterium]